MIHLTLQQLSTYLDGELPESSIELVRRHLSECPACTGRFARIEAQEEIMVRILVDEPDDRFFRELRGSIELGSGAAAGAKRAATPESKPSAKAPRRQEKPAKGRAPETKPAAKSAPRAEPPAKAAPAARVSEAPPGKPAPPPAPPAPPAPVAAPSPAIAPMPAASPEPEVAPAPAAPPPRPIAPAAPIVPARAAAPIPPPAPATNLRRRAEDRAEDRRSVVSGLVVAVALCLVLGSAAWIVLHRGTKEAPVAPAPAREDVAATPEPQNDEAAPREETSMPPAATPPAPERAPDVTPSPADDAALPAAPPPEVVEPPRPEAVPESEVAPEPKAEPKPAQAPPAKIAPKPKPKPKPAAKPAPTPAAAPERLVERPPENIVPVRTVVTETVLEPRDDAAAAPAPASPPASPAPSGAPPAEAIARALDDAKSASLRAARTKQPAAFDAASTAWERAIPLLGSSPEDLASARRELAQARFQAWAEEPTPARKDAAISAARVYLLYAPPGPERDQAWTWLARLKR